MITTYSSRFLAGFGANLSNIKLNAILWRNLCNLGISKVKPTRRGCRAGKCKQLLKTAHQAEERLLNLSTSSNGISASSLASNCVEHLPSSSLNIQDSTFVNNNIPVITSSNFQHARNSSTIMQNPDCTHHAPWDSSTKATVLGSITTLCSEFHRQLEIAHYASLENIDLKSVVGTRILKNVNLVRSSPVKNHPKARFACWNARSINNKTTIITDFVIGEKLDVVSLTETWLSGDSRDDRTLADICNTLKDFNIIHASRTNTKGGGVAVIHRKSMTVTRNDDHHYNAMECLDLNIKLGSKSLRHITIYRPPPSIKNGLTVKMFFDEFSNLIESLMASSCRCLLTGDFNFHLNDDNPDAQLFLRLLNSGSLTQHVKTPTHIKGHTLDLVITDSLQNIVSNLKTVPEMPSDHAALVFNVDFPRPSLSKLATKRRNVRGIDVDTFISDLSDTQLINDLSTDLDLAVDLYNSTLRSLVDKHAPEKTRVITPRPHSPWYNDSLRRLKGEKRRHERKWQSSGLEVYKQIYNQKAREYYDAINEAKRTYYHEKISSSTQKQLFHLVDGLFTVEGDPILPTYSDRCELANRFSVFFEEKISNLLDELSPSENLLNSDCHQYDTRQLSSSLNVFQPVTSEAVRTIIMSSRSKSCTLDPLPTTLLKDCFDCLVYPITTIINLSLQQGVFPSAYKHGVVTPIIKKQNSDPNILKNYRPITNLSFLSKTIERAVCKQLQQYLRDNNLYAKMQSAYRSYHSTETALLRVHNDISVALDNHKEVILVLLDLTAAFDMVDHAILLHRLKVRYGVGDRALGWIRSYLCERTQAVKIGDVLSSCSPLRRGVPQGSVMGPALFSLYVSPIEDIINKHGLSCAVYADDTQLYLSIDRSETVQGLTNLQHCVNSILQWMKANKLVCNTTKTEVIHFSSKFVNHEPLQVISVGHSDIPVSTSVRNLGAIFDQHLQMTPHVNSLCKSASFSLKRIGQIRRFLDDRSAEQLVHAFVTSKIDQCNSLLYGLSDAEISRLQMIQNSAARLVTKTRKNEHISPVLRRLHWLPVKKRIIFKVLLLTYKAMNGSAPEYLSELLEIYKPTRNLRSSNKHLLKVPSYRTKYYGKRAFSVFAPSKWNELPENIKQAKSVDSFKKLLKTFLFDKRIDF